MSTQIWLSNDTSDVSGYKVAYVGFRSPNASSTVSTAITGTQATTDQVAMTATSGGSAVKWITAPFESDVTVAGGIFANIWGLESSASSNASFGVGLYEYTTSEQSIFCSFSSGTETSTTAIQTVASRITAAGGTVAGGAYTSTTIDAGNRLVIKPFVAAVGTMSGAGLTVTMNYNGATAGADGDTYIELTETIYPDQVQFPPSGVSPSMTGGPSIIALTGLRRDLDPIVQEIASDDISWRELKNELEYLEGVETA
jgi:hypothetical protein